MILRPTPADGAARLAYPVYLLTLLPGTAMSVGIMNKDGLDTLPGEFLKALGATAEKEVQKTVALPS